MGIGFTDLNGEGPLINPKRTTDPEFGLTFRQMAALGLGNESELNTLPQPEAVSPLFIPLSLRHLTLSKNTADGSAEDRGLLLSSGSRLLGSASWISPAFSVDPHQ